MIETPETPTTPETPEVPEPGTEMPAPEQDDSAGTVA